MKSKLKILILEDNGTDVDLLLRELNKSDLDFISFTIQTKQDYQTSLAEFKPHLILSDYSLPAFDAVSAFNIKEEICSHVPFIIVSGFIGEENAIDLIKNGVTDYVSKERLYTLVTKIKRALGDAEEKKEKKVTAEKLALKSAELLALNQQLEVRVTKRTKELAASELLFRKMMETIPQIAWTNTIAGEVVYYNQRWYDYTGLDKNETQQSGFRSVIHPSDQRDSIKKYQSIISGIEGGEFQIRGKKNNGQYRWHLIRLMPILNEQDVVQLWVGTATDIEELRLLQQQKDDFISIASHELKTPITTLKACLQLLDRLKENPASAMLPKLISQANHSMAKVNIMIEDLLNASMANEGQLQIRPKKILLTELIADCCIDVRTEGIYELITEGPSTLCVYADAIRIEQVITNFVNNAIKYAADSKQIKILTAIKDGMAMVSVKDQGQGIHPDKLQHLFDRYYRVNGSESHYNGLGLGLYICSEIIKKHNGNIGVESELNTGTTFWFTLPLA